MGQIIQAEKIGALSKVSDSVVQLAFSIVNLGGQQYRPEDIQCDLTASGIGGLDTGSVAASTKYNVYFSKLAGTTGLIASKSDSPSGVDYFSLVGYALTNSSSIIEDVYVVGSSDDIEKKNAIINGAMEFWQRETDFNPAASNSYTADRWKTRLLSGGISYRVTREVSNGIARLGAYKTSVGASSDQIQITQQIEYENFKHLVGKYATVSFKAFAMTNLPDDFFVYMYYSTAQDSNITWGGGGSSLIDVISVPISSSMEMHTCYFKIPSDAKSLTLQFGYNKSDLSLQEGFSICDVGIYEGVLDNPEFIRFSKSYIEELVACQRYYEKSTSLGVYPKDGGQGMEFAGTISGTAQDGWIARVNYKVTKRYTCGVTVYDEAGNINRISRWQSGSGFNDVTANVNWKHSDAMSLIYYTGSASGLEFNWVADAEF